MSFPTLADDVYYNGPRSFTAGRLRDEPELFLQRAALFHTPTKNVPRSLVGEGTLDAWVPLTASCWLDLSELRVVPRLWVSLLQRATGKLRWRPLARPDITMVHYDVGTLGESERMMGAKCLRDALKVRTHGRYDGRPLYYFGAIEDDGPEFLGAVRHNFVAVEHPAKAGCRVIVSAPGRAI